VTGFLLSVHVLGAILAIGPVAVAASLFPRSVRDALAAPEEPQKTALAVVLNRIVRVYAVVGIVVPVFGFATGASLGVLGDPWLIVSIVLTAAAAAILIVFVLPGQRRALSLLAADAVPDAAGMFVRRLGMQAGIFNLLWAIVVVLMIYRPGSTTGAGL
jgi:sulfite exporter TauE/SafE